MGQQPGRNRKSQAESSDADTLERLARTSKDPFYKAMLEQRTIEKLHGTYVEGMLKRLAADDRLHPTFGHGPSTLRLSCQNPNLQNMAADEDDKWAVAFRENIVAAPGCKLHYYDATAIEAVITGWYMGDPDYMRLATLGVHDYVNSHYLAKTLKLIPEPASLKWSNEDLGRCFADLKERFPAQRKRVKHAVHGRNYALSAYGLNRQYPEWFPSVASAEEILKVYDECAPKLAPWQNSIRERAYKVGFLGGPLKQHSLAPGDWYRELISACSHPFGYKHWFWHIKDFKKITPSQAQQARAKGKPVAQIGNQWFIVSWGNDAKRCVAFFPQSTAAGIIAEAILRLFTPGSEHYIGDAYYGRTPLRAQVHDALLLEVPDAQEERVQRTVMQVMSDVILQMPCPPEWGLGDFLKIGVAGKIGLNWAEGGMSKVKLIDAA